MGSSALAVLNLYFGSHRMRAFGYYNVKIDRWAQGNGAYEAVRGREQQLIDYFGGVGSRTCGNAIRGVAKGNPRGRAYWNASTGRFGYLFRYTGY
jgi:hypothetical protein